MQAIHTEQYKGYTILIHQDPDAESPESYDNEDLFLITTRNRYFQVQRAGFDLDDARNGKYKKDYHVFPLIAYIHSGVALSITRGGQFSDPWDSGQIGYVFVKKRQGFRNILKAAQSLVEEWNDYLSGNVYGYVVNDPDGEQSVMSCWGFQGDYEKYALVEARAEIDSHLKWEAEEVAKIEAMQHV